MTNDEIKAFIAEQVAAGVSLSKIQDALNEKGAKMTFMELRLLASEIEMDVFRKQEEAKAAELAKKNPPPPPKEEPADTPASLPEEEVPQAAPPAGDEADDEKLAPRGKTVVQLTPIQRPGYYATGTVEFGSGASGEWLLDQTGRLMFDNLTGEPDKRDVMEFQVELRKLFGA